MFDFKYYAKIRAAQAQTASEPLAPLPPFDLAAAATKSRWAQAVSRFLFRRVMAFAFALMRAFVPNLKIGRLVIVTRDADVREVLRRNDVFTVPFGLEMTELAGGTNSVLGLEGSEHGALREAISEVLRAEDLADIRAWSRGYARALVEAGGGRLDVVSDLITRTATETCCRYFGLTVSDPDAFAQWTIAVSSLLFADPTGDPATRARALNGAARIRAVLDDSIARIRANDAEHPTGDRPHATLVDRLIRQGKLTDPQIRATLMGLATGFIPTNTLAAGNILEELLSRPRLLEEAKAAARAGDEAALRRTLLVAARRNPALAPGQWRYAAADAVIAQGTRRQRKVPKDSVLLVATMSALRDPRGRGANHPDPDDQAELLFGTGPHSCMGRWIALEQIVQTFMALLSQPELQVARGEHGWMQRVGPFPLRLDMTYASPTALQSMVIVSAPVRDGTSRGTIEAEIDRLGNPAADAVRNSLTETGIIHFASLSVIGTGGPDLEAGILLLELNADGPADAAILAVAERAFDWLGPIVAHCCDDGVAPATPEALARLLRDHALDLHCYPWGPIGIHFNGTPEFAVRDIVRQEKVSEFAREALKHYFHDELGRDSRAMDALTRVRRFIKQDSFYQLRPSWAPLREKSRDLEFAVVRPSRKRLDLAEWPKPASVWQPFGQLLRSRDGVIVLALLTAVWLAATAGAAMALGLPRFSLARGALASTISGALPVLLFGALLGLALTIAAATLVAGLFLLGLSAHERKDLADDRAPPLAHVAALAEKENRPGFEQNHILAVVPLKPGRFRKLVFAFALWGIKQSIRFWFRPGFVVTMGTIHYAKWFRVPGTEQFVFLSNYDGSWESYLEDFITRAHWGQTAAWSNGVGFPPTHWLIFDGAADGDRFKRWVRRQQRVTRFWYSRYPHLTTKQIRTNALIEDGLARASTDTDARRWLACFGSAQRELDELETAEVQSILFSGFGRMHHATCLVLRLPDSPEGRRTWLAGVAGMKVRHIDRPASPLFEHQPQGDGLLPRAMRIAFGDHPVSDGAAVLGLSARGLAKLGLDRPELGELSEFPPVFNLGMARRAAILGDLDSYSAQNWRWSDDVGAGADAVLIVYGELDASASAEGGDADAHAELSRACSDFLESCGGKVLDAIPTGPLPDEHGLPTLAREHFGFRDGISQPVIRGTQRAADQLAGRDLVEPGEFILGYRNNQGYQTPVLAVPAESDRRNELPVIASASPTPFPRFGSAADVDRRDFGRNGTFLVVRQLKQDVQGFWAAADRHARELTGNYPHLASALGREVDVEWVAAKLVGRWPNGSPLVGNPLRPAPSPGETSFNDFAYGVDDPQGLQCPMGAHVRRANPRDSLQPGDEAEQRITDRHRLLRRGRSFGTAADTISGEKGLLFMALCADIERQFEFVQHTWINSPAFHGLSREPDPLVSNVTAERGFTIPTAFGPATLGAIESYVKVCGGGYFFVPSRAALQYLAWL